MTFDSEKYGFPWDESKKKKRSSNDQEAKDFSVKNEHWRVFYKTHIYGGPWVTEPYKASVFDDETRSIIQEEISTPPLKVRTFIEILCNAADGISKTPYEYYPLQGIKITVTKHTVTIENDGLPIPVVPHEEECKDGNFGTVVDLIFGHIGSGSNLENDKNRLTSGSHGMGAKLTNILSSRFKVEVGDNIRGVHQIVEWSRNMCTKLKSECRPRYVKKGKKWRLDSKEDKYTGKNFVCVTYSLDTRRYSDDHYTKDDIRLFKKIAAEISFSVKVPVVFNGDVLDFRDIREFSKIMCKENYKNRIIITQLKPKDEKKNYGKKELQDKIKTGEIKPELELCMICNPGNGFHSCYTNGVYNIKGGVHTNEAYKLIMDAIKKLAGTEKSLGLLGMDVKSLNIKFLKNNAILFLNYFCKNPAWEGQCKEKLAGPTPKIRLSSENVENIKKWKIFEEIYKKFTEKKKGSISKKRMKIKGFIEANFVGKKGKIVGLIPCEGDSAGQYIDEYILECGKIEQEKGNNVKGWDIWGKLAMKGKLKNTSGLSIQLIDLAEKNGNQNILVKFMTAMGLIDGVDYQTKEGYDSLRYKKCRVIVDADNDGSHILCLLINFLYRRFPSFLKAGLLSWVCTPVIRAVNKKNGKTIKRFYSAREYDEWRTEHPNVSHNADYFKGLAAASKEQAKEDARESPNVVLWFDKEADIYLNIAFDRKSGSSAKRKDWILRFKDGIDKKILKMKKKSGEKIFYTKISSLINTKLIEYSLETLPRCIPSRKDHLKDSVRILMAFLIEHYTFGAQNKKVMNAEVIASGAKSKFNYHHGAAILIGVISRLANDFAGSNNLPFLTNESMMGSREKNGKNAGAGRYIKGRTNWWVKFLVKKSLYNMIDRRICEGDKCEPLEIPFLLPVGLMNKVRGVSSGWSTDIPVYHPYDMAEFVKRLISGKKVFPMIPWFIRFTGNVSLGLRANVKKHKKKQKNEDDDEEEEDEEEEEEEEEDEEKGKKKLKLVLITEGIYEIKKEYEKKIKIEEEDPENYGKMIKTTKIQKFTDFIIEEIAVGYEASSVINDISTRCEEPPETFTEDSYTPKYRVKGYQGEIKPDEIGVFHQRVISNMHFVSSDGIPYHYDNVYQIIEDYCSNITSLFEKQKKLKLKALKERIKFLEDKSVLIDLVRKEKWSLIKKRAQIRQDLESLKITFDVYKSIGSDEYSDEGYEECLQEIKKVKNEYKTIKETPAVNEWIEDIEKFQKELNKREEYKKLEKHEYPKVKVPLKDLTSGKVMSPFPLW